MPDGVSLFRSRLASLSDSVEQDRIVLPRATFLLRQEAHLGKHGKS